MKKKIIIFGASSHISSSLINQIKSRYEIITISSKKQNIKQVKSLKTNYNLKSIVNFLNLNIKKKDKPIFLFFNTISDENIPSILLIHPKEHSRRQLFHSLQSK